MKRAPLLLIIMSLLLLVLVPALAACPPPPPPPEEPDAGFPDAGTIGVVGDECFSPTTTNACEDLLECAALVDAAAGTFACVEPGAVRAPCFFNNNEVELTPPDDGCQAGLTCGGLDECVPLREIDAPCTSPADCESANCGSLPDGTGSVCVPNECAAGCPEGTTCRTSGLCGLTCVTSPQNGEACFVAGVGPCSPVRTVCNPGLECYRGDANNTTCDSPGDEGSNCRNDTVDDGCLGSLVCDPTGECVE